jgi:uncharacterized protein (UPF0248 family)
LAVRNILNKLIWDSRENIANYKLTFIHRGAPGDVKTIPCSLIREVRISWFTYGNEGEEETIIPFHRVLEIRNATTGEAIWRKKLRGD